MSLFLEKTISENEKKDDIIAQNNVVNKIRKKFRRKRKTVTIKKFNDNSIYKAKKELNKVDKTIDQNTQHAFKEENKLELEDINDKII